MGDRTNGEDHSLAVAALLRSKICGNLRCAWQVVLAPDVPPADKKLRTFNLLSKAHIQQFRINLKILPFRLINEPLSSCYIRACTINTCEKSLSKHSRLMGRQLTRKKPCNTRYIKLYKTTSSVPHPLHSLTHSFANSQLTFPRLWTVDCGLRTACRADLPRRSQTKADGLMRTTHL